MNRILILALICSVLPSPSQADTTVADCSSALCRLLNSSSASKVQAFYRSNHFAFAWIRQGKITEQARELIQILKQAETKGLNPGDYDGPLWAARLLHLESTRAPDQREGLCRSGM